MFSFSDCLACPIEGQIRKECASDPSCHLTCEKPVGGICPLVCIINGCECPAGTVIDEDIGECVAPKECGSMLHYKLFCVHVVL